MLKIRSVFSLILHFLFFAFHLSIHRIVKETILINPKKIKAASITSIKSKIVYFLDILSLPKINSEI